MRYDSFSLHEDELLYSAISRHKYLLGGISMRDYVYETFGDNCSIPSYSFPCNLDSFVKRLPQVDLVTSEYIIFNHTLFPAYKSFMPAKRSVDLINQMKYNAATGFQNKLGICAGGILRKKELYFCPECSIEEIEKFGQPYFHRLHQLEGVSICDKHMKVLKIFKNKIDESRFKYRLLNKNDVLSVMVSENDIKFESEMVWLNEQFKKLLSGELNVSKECIHNAYSIRLQELDLALPSGSIRQYNLYERFTQKYSIAFLRFVESDIDFYNEFNWLKVVTRNSKRTTHPLRHILLIGFLFDNISNLIEYISTNIPSKINETFPCLNPVCKFYLKDVIDNNLVSYDYKAKKVIGTFKCACGFSYSRELLKNNKYVVGRIKEFGEVWKDELRSNLSYGFSITKIAQIMRCDKKTVIRQTLLLGLGDKIKTKYNSIEEFDAKVNEYRRNKTKGNEYRIKSNEKINPISTKVSSMVDWKLRDLVIVNELKSILPKLYSDDRKYRVSKTLMCRAIGRLSLVTKNLEKLPETKKLIEKSFESIEEFQCYRIDRACSQIIKEGEDLRKWIIIRKAGIGKNMSDRVEKHLENWL